MFPVSDVTKRSTCAPVRLDSSLACQPDQHYHVPAVRMSTRVDLGTGGQPTALGPNKNKGASQTAWPSGRAR
jgi:hypothetical protein